MQTGNLAWWDMDCATGKVLFNEQKVRMLGYTPEEFTDAHYTDFTELVHPEDHERTMQAMRDHLDGKKPKYEVEYRIRIKSGGWKWFYDVGRITERDEDGTPVRVTGVVVDITERKRAENALKMVASNLRERIKELRSLYGISQLVDTPGISFEEILQGIVELITFSWQYPEITCARILLEDQEFKTENFRETIWKQTSDIIVHGNRIGVLEVYYLEKMPESDEGPFQNEERNLINAIAERVGKIIIRKQTEEKLKEYTEKLENLVEQRAKDLKESEERLQAILTGIGDLITIQNKDLDIIWANKPMQEIYGDVIGKKCYRVYKGLEEKCPDCTVERVLVEEKSVVTQRPNILPDGRTMHILTTSSPIRDTEGNIIAVVEVVKDITERKHAEEALKKSEARLAEAQRIAHLGNWDWNIQTNELHWSDEIYRIFGLTPQEFGATYDAFLNSVHPEDREFVTQSVDEALYERKPYSIDHRIILPDGEVRIVHEQAEVTFDETGRPVRMMGTVLDITEQKKLERQLIESERRYRGLYESSIDGILSADMDNRIIECNHAFADMLGYSKDELSKLNTSDITPSNSHDMGAEIISEQVIKRGYSDEFETELLKKDGTLLPVSARIWLIKDKDGNPAGTWGIVRTIMKRKRTEDTLKNGV
jgi:PAS domain S-box-containing protein